MMPLERPRTRDRARRQRWRAPVWPLVVAGAILTVEIWMIHPSAPPSPTDGVTANAGYPAWMILVTATVVVLAAAIWHLGSPRRTGTGAVPVMTMVEVGPSFTEDPRHQVP